MRDREGRVELWAIGYWLPKGSGQLLPILKIGDSIQTVFPALEL